MSEPNAKLAFERKRDVALGDVALVRVEGEPSPVGEIHDLALVEQLELRFRATLKASSRLAGLIEAIEANGHRYCVFGGWLRDTVSQVAAAAPAEAPKDIDLVVRGVELDDLLHWLSGDVKPTIFGGIQSDAPPVAFDVWPLHDTFLIRRLKLPATFEGLLKSTDFTINAGLFFPKQGAQDAAMMDGGLLQALRSRRVAFNCGSLVFPTMQCARLAAYAGKLSLELAPPVRAFMREIVADPARLAEVRQGLAKFYPGHVADAAERVLQELIEVDNEN
ncbi:hypothetical protein PMI42_06969 [Bradyrhizobium sp. YR681]|nr:hypothetical protein PMI42_06969 [Bradyrhizobium sp. YR681]